MGENGNQVTDRSGVTVLGTALLGGCAALVALAVLLVVSPASFVSLMPDWVVADRSDQVTAWVIVATCVLAAVLLGLARGRAPRLRGVAITVLLLAAAGSASNALASRASEQIPEPACVERSGGPATCPGG
ncbi:hypothetical protein [Paractinoplanes rishiriensis]|uniref:Uncharacterized protein n=1 Tax=Paractinoplanes rishiriensis TaxID=1050105 RepID=A0A919K6A6_9ACTN|nr:hypothetical protein [Actinoplanes rishiriensis]GIE99567.1 hypothetical protein Ari01nite_70320 [Actinoplanes rishiriensis]